MNNQQILTVLRMYADRLERQHYNPVQHTDEDSSTRVARLEHIHWMCREILEQDRLKPYDSFKPNEKWHRWLGFIQGVLYSERLFTINEMREHNR